MPHVLCKICQVGELFWRQAASGKEAPKKKRRRRQTLAGSRRRKRLAPLGLGKRCVNLADVSFVKCMGVLQTYLICMALQLRLLSLRHPGLARQL